MRCCSPEGFTVIAQSAFGACDQHVPRPSPPLGGRIAAYQVLDRPDVLGAIKCQPGPLRLPTRGWARPSTDVGKAGIGRIHHKVS